MGYSIKELRKTVTKAKKYVRFAEGAALYSMGIKKFQAMAINAKAVYKIGRINLVNLEIFEKYLETFKLD